MKPRFDENTHDETSDSIRSDIAHTRERMDHTLDEIGERMTPRHLLDEVLDYFRSHRPDKGKMKEKAGAMADRAGEVATHAGHAVADVIRQHPVPTLLIGAGIAWAFYERQRKDERYYELEDDLQKELDPGQVTGESGAESADQTLKSASENVEGKVAAAGEQVRQKGREIKRRAAEKGRVIRMKASEFKQRMAEGTKRTYAASRDKIIETGEAHPLSIGLGMLAFGVLAGLALPHTRQEDEWLGTTSDRVKARAKEQGRDYLERGKHVATAAVEAAKHEAAEQGLSPETLQEKAREVGHEAKAAAQEAARDETPGRSPRAPEREPEQSHQF